MNCSRVCSRRTIEFPVRFSRLLPKLIEERSLFLRLKFILFVPASVKLYLEFRLSAGVVSRLRHSFERRSLGFLIYSVMPSRHVGLDTPLLVVGLLGLLFLKRSNNPIYKVLAHYLKLNVFHHSLSATLPASAFILR